MLNRDIILLKETYSVFQMCEMTTSIIQPFYTDVSQIILKYFHYSKLLMLITVDIF